MLVSFVVVALNSGDKLDSLIGDLIKQDYDHNKIEIIFIDSNSTDNTKAIMNNLLNSEHRFLRVCVLDNPKRILPCGWNIALKESKGDLIIRVDAHSSIPSNFIRRNVEALSKGEKIVGGHRISIIDEKNPWQKTLLMVETSLFGSGIAAYRRTREKKYVDTLAHAAYSRDVFKTVGGYDERLARTEDNEIHYRMKQVGFRFLLDPDIMSFHYARNTLPRMLKQKYMNGYWVGLTLGICPGCLSVYHFVPCMFIFSVLLSLLIGAIGIWEPAILIWGCYFTIAVCMTALSIMRYKFHITVLSLPILFFLIHMSNGIGTIIGLVKTLFLGNRLNYCPEIDRVKEALASSKADMV